MLLFFARIYFQHVYIPFFDIWICFCFAEITQNKINTHLIIDLNRTGYKIHVIRTINIKHTCSGLNVDLMLCRRRRRRPNIKSTLSQRYVFVGLCHVTRGTRVCGDVTWAVIRPAVGMVNVMIPFQTLTPYLSPVIIRVLHPALSQTVMCQDTWSDLHESVYCLSGIRLHGIHSIFSQFVRVNYNWITKPRCPFSRQVLILGSPGRPMAKRFLQKSKPNPCFWLSPCVFVHRGGGGGLACPEPIIVYRNSGLEKTTAMSPRIVLFYPDESKSDSACHMTRSAYHHRHSVDILNYSEGRISTLAPKLYITSRMSLFAHVAHFTLILTVSIDIYKILKKKTF